jgi:hypothetical protein
MPQKGSFFIKKKRKEKKRKSSSTILLSSLVFIFASQNKVSSKIQLITTSLCHGPLPISTREHFLPLPPQNPLDHING